MRAGPIPINWNPDLSIFASEPFLKSVGDEYGWLGGFSSDNELKCILPYTIIRKAFFFRLVRFRTETIPVGDGLTIEEEKSFLNSAIDYFQSIKTGMVIPATTNSIFRTFPDRAIAAPFGTYIVHLDQPEEMIFGNFCKGHRRKVRVAEKNGVQIESGLEHLETAHTLIQDTFRRSKLPFMGMDAFKRMAMGLGENVKILVALNEGVVQGCAVVPFSSSCAYCVYAGSISGAATGLMNLLHWEAMRLFRNLGVKRYDFVGGRIRPEKGSKHEGLNTFKERFGGELIQGYVWKYPLCKWCNFVYELAIQFTKGGDLVDSEKRKLVLN